ncbi:MAG: phosphopantetheine-binding protein [Bacteroidales bacterium]|nr:phosphopantetheine-binding protein [Bacteroidales bacterium]
MDINAFILEIENEFNEIPKGKLKPESNYKEALNLSSISSLILIALIDNKYDLLIESSDLKQSQTLNELFEIIIKRKNINNK